MTKNNFILVPRYKVVLNDNTEIVIDLKPEEKWYFQQQERSYLINAIRHQDNIDINKVIRIEKYFIPIESEHDISIVIGL